MAVSPHLQWFDLILGSTELGHAMNEPYRNQYGLSDHSSVDEIINVCGKDIFDEYYSFSLVRNPLDRVVSAYNFIHTLCTWYCKSHECSKDGLSELIMSRSKDDPLRNAALLERPFLQWKITEAFLDTSDFGSFVRHPLVWDDRAFSLQADLLQSKGGHLRVKNVFKLEEIVEALPVLSDQLGIDINLERHNESKFKLIDRSELQRRDTDFLKEAFSRDFREFSYSI